VLRSRRAQPFPADGCALVSGRIVPARLAFALVTQLELPDFTMHYRREGAGEPVVVVHGGFACLGRTLYDRDQYEWSWEYELAREVDLVTYDRRGCRLSSRPADGYELDRQAGDLEALLDHLGLRSVHVVGSSAGGPIAVLFASERPDRTRSLVLVGTGLDLFPRREAVTELVRAQVDLLERAGPEAAFDARPAGVEVWFETLWRGRDAEARGELDAHLDEEALLAERAARLPREERVRWYATELRNLAAYLDLDLVPVARRVHAPTLVLHGEQDAVVPPASGEELSATIPSARLHLVRNGFHGLLYTSDEARRTALAWIAAAGR
jgi:pimeloyl-ACP methyl ester carboxylesterase